MPFDEFLRRRIFTPFALTSTSIGTAPKDLRGGALGYTVTRAQTVKAPPQDAAQFDFGDGGVNSTVLDLISWDHALDSGGVLNKHSLEMMFTPSPNTIVKHCGYGLGVRIGSIDGHREVMHAGEWTGYAGENATFPDDGLALIVLSNTDGFDEDPLMKQLFELVTARAVSQ
jgi:CubicO group peptidase (beta-lactamase class C family)